MGSIANIDQWHQNMLGFARKTNSPFIPWSRDEFFEGQ